MVRNVKKSSDKRPLSKTQRAIVANIKDLHRRHQPLNITAVKREHPELIESVYKITPFWGWKQALDAAGIGYQDIRVELEDEVQCRLCGVWRQSLLSHLKINHDCTTAEYRTDFPDAPIQSEIIRARMRARVAQLIIPHWEPIWSPEYVLDRVAEIHRMGMDVAFHSIQIRDGGLGEAARRYFQDWDVVLRRVGLDPFKIRKTIRPRMWTKARVLDELRASYKRGTFRSGRPQKGISSLFFSMLQFFPTRRAAYQAAGIPPEAYKRARQPTYGKRERESLLKAVRAAARVKGVRHAHAVLRLRKRFRQIAETAYSNCWGRIARQAV